MRLRSFTRVAAACYAAALPALCAGVYLLAQDPLAATAVPTPPDARTPRVPFDCRAYRGDDDGFTCLACNSYFEARGETLAGQIAVAKVVIERMKDPRYPKTLCAVVWQRGQFSWTSENTVVRDRHAWDVASVAARLAVDEAAGHGSLRAYIPTSLAGALRFHTPAVAPEWRGYQKATQIGNHIFYREAAR